MTQQTKKAHQLCEGDMFSYVGAFKVYEALSDAEICNAFRDGLYLERPRARLRVTDGGVRGDMGVRLLAYQDCVIHEGFGKCDANGNRRDD